MGNKKRYVPKAPRWFNILLRYSLGVWLKGRFRIRAQGQELFKGLKPPYVIVPTHHGILDPFMVGTLVPEPIYWVTSDGNMRSSIMRLLLGLVGSIPKSKVIPDIETVGWIVDVIRRRGGVVGVFAEGQSSWDGHTQDIIPSTGKLLKLLKVPVVVAVLKGSYFSQPRWSWSHRPGDLEIEFKQVMDGDEVKASSPEGILQALREAMEYDEEKWREAHPAIHRSSRRARHLELSLFMCPVCNKAGTMRSYVNRLYCRACGHVVRLSKDYKFTAVGACRPRFSTIREWDLWQKDAFAALLAKAREEPDRPVFSDSGVLLLRGYRMHPLYKIRTGSLILFPDRLELATLSGERLRFPIADVEGEGVLKQQLLEFYVGKNLYQARFPRRFQSARKWLSAISALKLIQAATPTPAS